MLDCLCSIACLTSLLYMLSCVDKWSLILLKDLWFCADQMSGLDPLVNNCMFFFLWAIYKKSIILFFSSALNSVLHLSPFYFTSDHIFRTRYHNPNKVSVSWTTALLALYWHVFAYWKNMVTLHFFIFSFSINFFCFFPLLLASCLSVQSDWWLTF